MEDLIERFQSRLAEIRHLMVDLDVHEQEQEREEGNEEVVEGDLFGGVDAGAVRSGDLGEGYRPTGFGNAVLDEQD